MLLPVSPVQPLAKVTGIAGPQRAAMGKPGEFSSVMESAIQGVDKSRAQANQQIQSLLNGDGAELHTTALSVQKAEMAFELGLQIRNKVVSAYQEVMKMQI
jgi:flagellar hook-basal body complex protein FliE